MRKKYAFTLVELSTSLIIIALIVGSITSGLYIKRRAELNSIMDQFAKLESAYNNFKTIYLGLPGDLPLYTNSAFGTGSIAGINILYGNGNGIIDNSSSSPYEGLIALQHLAFANLISGNYLGTTSIINNNINWYYKNSYNTLYGYYFGSNTTTSGSNFSVFDSNVNDTRSSIIVYAKMRDNLLSTRSVISPVEMYKLDLKYDDGYPTTGNIVAAGGSDNTTGCIDTLTNSYKTSSLAGCYIGVILDKKSKF